MKGNACARRRAWVWLSEALIEDPFGWFGAFYLKNTADGIIQTALLIEMIRGNCNGRSYS
ncbi:hypothetical protein RvVAR031_07480 [Agrobacterium vitis]|nr:hypothetical protein RvVAR031_07480 [Agrobacterium vitis]